MATLDQDDLDAILALFTTYGAARISDIGDFTIPSGRPVSGSSQNFGFFTNDLIARISTSHIQSVRSLFMAVDLEAATLQITPNIPIGADNVANLYTGSFYVESDGRVLRHAQKIGSYTDAGGFVLDNNPSYITYNGTDYVCKVAHVSSIPTEPEVGSHWMNFWDVSAGGPYNNWGIYTPYQRDAASEIYFYGDFLEIAIPAPPTLAVPATTWTITGYRSMGYSPVLEQFQVPLVDVGRSQSFLIGVNGERMNSQAFAYGSLIDIIKDPAPSLTQIEESTVLAKASQVIGDNTNNLAEAIPKIYSAFPLMGLRSATNMRHFSWNGVQTSTTFADLIEIRGFDWVKNDINGLSGLGNGIVVGSSYTNACTFDGVTFTIGSDGSLFDAFEITIPLSIPPGYLEIDHTGGIIRIPIPYDISSRISIPCLVHGDGSLFREINGLYTKISPSYLEVVDIYCNQNTPRSLLNRFAQTWFTKDFYMNTWGWIYNVAKPITYSGVISGDAEIKIRLYGPNSNQPDIIVFDPNAAGLQPSSSMLLGTLTSAGFTPDAGWSSNTSGGMLSISINNNTGSITPGILNIQADSSDGPPNVNQSFDLSGLADSITGNLWNGGFVFSDKKEPMFWEYPAYLNISPIQSGASLTQIEGSAILAKEATLNTLARQNTFLCNRELVTSTNPHQLIYREGAVEIARFNLTRDSHGNYISRTRV